MNLKTFLAGTLLASGTFLTNAQVTTANLTSYGLNAGTTGTSGGRTFYGYQAGNSGKGLNCTFLGDSAGIVNTGSVNTFVGSKAGYSNLNGSCNVFVGYYAGYYNTSGQNNTCLGYNTGAYTGSNNTYLGMRAGLSNQQGNNNIAIGFETGKSSQGSNNIYIGSSVGSSSTEDNKLMIDIVNTTSPLIWGDFAQDLVKLNGKVGVGGVTTFPNTAGGVDLSTYKLFIKGGLLAEEVRVATTWADYVFDNDYKLASLEDVECFINENCHLPNVPSGKQVEEEGISIGEIAKIQQEKIEELTLYIIAQDKRLKQQQEKIDFLEKQGAELQELKVLVQGLIAKK